MGGSNNPPDKRRAGHVLRTGSTSSARNVTSSMNSTASGSGTTGASVIAPPPKAAIHGGSSGGSTLDETGSSGGTAVASSSSSSPPSAASPGAAGSSGASGPTSAPTSTAGAGGGGSSAIPTLTITDPVLAAAVAQLQSGIRARDTRIAELTRELGTMEAEFGRELDRLSQTESETAAFWQAKHSALHGRFLAADTELRILRDELAARDARDMSLALLAQQQSQQQHRQQQAGVDPATAAGPASGTESLHGNHKHHHHHHAPQPAADNRPSQSPSVAELESRLARFAERENALLASLDEARAQCAAREEEARSLRAQVRGLKEWVSTSTRALGGSDGRTSDEVFGEGMARLGNGLQNWVIMNFRRAKVQDLSKLPEDVLTELSELVPMYDELAHTAKVHLLQSIVSRILVKLIFDAYFVGLSDSQAKKCLEMESFLSSFGSAESVNQWRSLTLTILRREGIASLQAETDARVDAVLGKANRILDSLTDARATESRDQALRTLVNDAVGLARLLAVQRAVFRVEMPEIVPHQKTMFDPETMDDIGGEDEESLANREICCVTFPGIVKTGDENGSHLQYRNVIARARVLCSPE